MARAQTPERAEERVDDGAPDMAPDVALPKAISYYEAGRYAECAAAFADLLKPGSPSRPRDSEAVERARMYSAACLMAVGKLDAADGEFRAAIRENPQIAIPSSVVFPQAVVDRFILVRASMLEEIRRADEERTRGIREEAELARRREELQRQRVAELEQLARQETIVVRNERWIATVPFGVGQFQNRDYLLGSAFLLVETGLLATAVTATAIQLSLHEQINGGRNLASSAQLEQLNSDLETANLVALGATGGLLLTAALGIVEAHLSFLPEHREGVRQRPTGSGKPNRPGLSVRPAAAASAAGAFLRVHGAF